MDIIGHRGARGEAPENTLSGFYYLRDLGISRVEFDIQVAGDGQLIVIHDDILERTTNHHGSIKDVDSDALFNVDATRHLFPDWPIREGVPTLRQVLAVLADFEHLQLEVKAKTLADCQAVVQQLPELWQPFGKRAVTTSFNVDYLRMMQAHHPHIPRGLLVERHFVGDMIGLAKQLECSLIAPHHSLLTNILIDSAHQQGLVVSTWTVNDTQRMQDLAAMGLDSLITDYPSMALKHLYPTP
ncbi:glycerophosphodiester phosphodiesterase [Agitococcus lubricus]|uniref:Glycerophosphoryl diester phosphodiesterase n=1 Tax=Agitococcus lubricus TaxID=1077255 RepID=A0A2T5J0A6_9GAMM|nr:glycerophosphodiester phosphodiesterase family protein [Agitococcus lubricus]PTQ89745.1 glycerophosphoryl diester phosphodiesterase [Agitococcus lubricus]